LKEKGMKLRGEKEEERRKNKREEGRRV